MKRKFEPKSRAVFGDILKATTVEQRAWIGAVVLAYNKAEHGLHNLTGLCLGYIGLGLSYAVTSRINGTDGLIAIIYGAVASLQLSEDQSKLFNAALSEHGFAHLKKLRDAVIHAELSDTSTDTAIAPGKRGERQDVLLSCEALEGLYRRLTFIEKEFGQLDIILRAKKAIRFLRLFGAQDDPRLALSAQDILDATAQCLSHQRQRLSLPPFPKFPEPPTQDEILQKWLASSESNKSMTIYPDQD